MGRLTEGGRLPTVFAGAAVSALLLCGCSTNGVSRDDERADQDFLGLAIRHIPNKGFPDFEKAVIAKAKAGTDADLRAALILCMEGSGNTGQYNNTVVALLKASGDERFRRVLRRLPPETRDGVASVLAALLWDVDDDESFQRAKSNPDSHFPETWRLVFEILK